MLDKQQTLRQLLNHVEQEMRQIALWDVVAPSPEAMESSEPFAIDTLKAHQWLQWIFLPRMHALLDAKLNLPANFSLHPYFEEALSEEEETKQLLSLIKQIDQLCKE